MNNEIKVSLTVILQGRVMLSQESADALEKLSPASGYNKHSIVVSDSDGKNREVLEVRTRKSVPATQSININVEGYEHMTDDNYCPYWSKENVWKAMQPKARLEAHLQRICSGLDGVKFTYKVFED